MLGKGKPEEQTILYMYIYVRKKMIIIFYLPKLRFLTILSFFFALLLIFYILFYNSSPSTLQKKSILHTFLRRFLYAIKMHIMHKTKLLMLLKIRSNSKY